MTISLTQLDSDFLTPFSPQAYYRPDLPGPTSTFLILPAPVAVSSGPRQDILECADWGVPTAMTSSHVIVPQSLRHKDIIRPRKVSSKNDDFSSP